MCSLERAVKTPHYVQAILPCLCMMDNGVRLYANAIFHGEVVVFPMYAREI